MEALDDIALRPSDWMAISELISGLSISDNIREILIFTDKVKGLNERPLSAGDSKVAHRKYLSARHWYHIKKAASQKIGPIGRGPCPDQFSVGSCFTKVRREVDEETKKYLRLFNYAWQEENTLYNCEDHLFFINQLPTTFQTTTKEGAPANPFHITEGGSATIEWSKGCWVFNIYYSESVESDEGKLATGYESDILDHWKLKQGELEDILHKSPEKIKQWWREAVEKGRIDYKPKIQDESIKRYIESEEDNIDYLVIFHTLQGVTSEEDMALKLQQEHNFHLVPSENPTIYRVSYVPDWEGWVYRMLGHEKFKDKKETRFKRCLYGEQIRDLTVAPLYWQVESVRLLARGKIKGPYYWDVKS